MENEETWHSLFAPEITSFPEAEIVTFNVSTVFDESFVIVQYTKCIGFFKFVSNFNLCISRQKKKKKQ